MNFLKNASDSEQYAGSPTIRSRLDEMIVLLDQYTANALMAGILTLMSRPCGMMPEWWCWSWVGWKTVRPCLLR